MWSFVRLGTRVATILTSLILGSYESTILRPYGDLPFDSGTHNWGNCYEVSSERSPNDITPPKEAGYRTYL